MSIVVLASFSAIVIEAEGAAGVFGSGIVEQELTGSPLQDFTAATTLTATGTGSGAPSDGGGSLSTAVGSVVRWTGSRIKWIDDDLPPSATYGEIALEQDMTPGRQATFRFQTVGELWAMPTPEDFDDTPPDPGDPAPPAPPPPPAPGDPDNTPRPWGNKPVEGFLSFGQSPRSMNEARVFKGVSLQKSNRGDVAIMGEIVCVDDSIRYADVPLCYEIGPFGGKTRGEITREMALAVGIPAEDIGSIPIGNLVTKPIMLSNGSLLPFLAEFWKGENGFPHFDEHGKLVVDIINLKTTADWTIDASLGDYDFDSFEETPAARPPSRYYVKAAFPATGSATETNEGSETTTDEETGLYNPKCVKVRPSGQASNLQTDGSYRVAASDSSMVVRRTVTIFTTIGGRIATKIVEHFSWYNPFAYDPNFNTAPPGTSYDGAYGDQTFHRDEAESLMLTSTETTAYSYDPNGTMQRQTDTVEGWYAPKRAGNYAADRLTLTNGNGAYVFPCSSSRTIPVETYRVTSRVEKSYLFDAAGIQTRVSEKTFGYFAPPAACDVYKDDVTSAVTAPPSSPYQSPCPGGGGAGGGGAGGGGGGGGSSDPPTFQPTITGPVSQGAGLVTFAASALGIPTGVVDPVGVNLTTVETLEPGVWVFNATTGRYDWVASGLPYESTSSGVLDTWPTGFLETWVSTAFGVGASIPISPYAYSVLTVRDANGVDYVSEPTYFDSRYGRTDPQGSPLL